MKRSFALCITACAALAAARPALAQTLEELDAACYNARAAKIKVVQERKIEKCLTAPLGERAVARSREDCERYWGTYGWTKGAANGKQQPYLFRNLPECRRAAEARAKAQ
jgi:hypothetical protein